MTRWVFAVALMGLLLPVLARCQEGPPPDRQHEMQLQRMQLELDQQQAEAEFQRERRRLELEARRLDLEHATRKGEGGAAVLLILCAVVHILVAVWVYQDIRHRNAGSGLWIVLGLLAGLLAALVYAVVRLGDVNGGKKTASSR